MAVTAPHAQLKHVSPSLIERNPENPRLFFRQEELDQLLTSIDKHGVQVPLVVYKEGSRFRLMDGERRWMCAQKLNLPVVPVLIHEKPSELNNLLLMYDIHALREQWDYFTIATKLTRVIKLFELEHGHVPTEIELSEGTGLTRGQIRRCRLLLDLPIAFKVMLEKELQLPKAQQKLSEDLFIEMERSLKAVVKRIPDYAPKLDKIRRALVKKFRAGQISAVTDFRQLSKIATAIDKLGIAAESAKGALDRVFDPNDATGIRDAYNATVAFEYDEQEALRYVHSLSMFVDSVIQSHSRGELDDSLVEELTELQGKLKALLG